MRTRCSWGALALVAVVATGCGPAVGAFEEPGESTDSSRHDIVGGAPTSDFPAAGAITRYGSPHCTGTLIEPRKVLTAAHCLEGVSAGQLKFVIGASLSTAQAAIAVTSITPHPYYDAQKLNNDIGFMTLAQDAPVAPMKVLPKMDGSWVGRDLVYVGYGLTSGNGGGSGVKRSVTMPISSVSATKFVYQTPGKNTCNGDSGGPAFAKVGSEWFVAGVTSYGDAFCNQYGVDTRADVFAAFLAVKPATPPAGNPENPPPGAGDPCNGETYEGRCDGSTVVWCDNGQVHQQPCAAQGKVCGFAPQQGYYACVAADPCQGETYQGRCDGSTVVWCENDQVKTLSCNQCGYDANKGFYNCL